MPSPTPVPDVNELLARLVDGTREVLGERVVAVYLLGSFAAGHFDRHSDVDFLVALEDDVPADRLADLQALHGRLFEGDSAWSRRLDGSYIPRPILRRADPKRTPLLYLDNGSRKLVRSLHCNRHVIRWMAREQGIALFGPSPEQLIDPVPRAALRREMGEDMVLWAAEIEGDPAMLDSQHDQPYTVLGYCRMLATLETGEVLSKDQAARWAKGALDPRWHGLIDRASALRGDPALGVRQPADPADLALTRAFIDDALSRASRVG